MRGIRAARYALGAVLGAVRGLGGRGSTSGRLQKSKACATTSDHLPLHTTDSKHSTSTNFLFITTKYSDASYFFPFEGVDP